MYRGITALLTVVATFAMSIWASVRKEKQDERLMVEQMKAMAEKPDTPATPAAVPPPPAITHEIPGDPALAAYMQNLPQKIETVGDVKRMAAMLEARPKIGLWNTAISNTIELIHPTELIYAMTWNAHCVTASNEGKDYSDSHGVVFFSNMRFLYFRDPANIIEFPLQDIYTVDAHRGQYFDGISFRTPTLHVQLSFDGAIDRKLFRDMVIHIAASAVAYRPTEGAADAKTLICECPGCGAAVIIHAGTVNKCEYCGRLTGERQETPQHIPQATCLAAEIKKYNNLKDQGILSEEEFESIKAKLLNKL